MKKTRNHMDKRSCKKRKELKLKELERKILPSPLANKKPPIPPPYPPGARYGLAKRVRESG